MLDKSAVMSDFAWARLKERLKSDHSLIVGLSSNSIDDVDARVSVDEAWHFSDLEGKASLFKSSLHLSRAEHAQVTALFAGATLAVLNS